MLILLLLFAVGGLQAQAPTSFTIIATDCKVTGPVNGKEVSSYSGSLWTATCKVRGDSLLIASMELDSKKPIGNETYEYHVSESFGIAVSKGGAIRYILDFTERKFYHGQVNIVLEKGTVLTKSCLGRIEFK